MKYDTTKQDYNWNNWSDAFGHVWKYENKNRSFKIMHNTIASIDGTNAVVITLHNTDIYRINWSHSGSSTITLDSGGWQTVTTKDRINRFLPLGFRLIQRNWNWIIQEMEDGTYRDRELFHDGMQIKLELG